MKSLRFAFVCCRPKAAGFESGPSFIYRCQNLGLALEAAGHHVRLAHYSKLDQLFNYNNSASPPYDVIVFHRPRYSFGFRLALRRLRKAGTLCVADFDDMVFAPQWAQYSPGVVNQQVTLKQTQKNFQVHAKALGLFRFASVSTLPLQEDMQQSHGITPWFIPNAVHLHWRTPAPTEHTARPPLLTYFPGTRSHDRDFAMIKAPLAAYMADHPEVRLEITGELADDSILKDFNSTQLTRHPKQSFANYRAHVARSTVNLAPLETTQFNQRKSALKAIEASFFNTPTLASPIPDMQRLSGAGAILVGDKPDDWYHAIKTHMHSADTHQHLRASILEHADAQRIAAQFIDLLSAHLSDHLNNQSGGKSGVTGL